MVLGNIDLDEKWSLEVRPYYHNKQKSPMFLNVSRPRAIAHVAKVIVASCVKCSQCETATLSGIIVRARRPRLGDCQALHTGQIKTYLMEEVTQPKGEGPRNAFMVITGPLVPLRKGVVLCLISLPEPR